MKPEVLKPVYPTIYAAKIAAGYLKSYGLNAEAKHLNNKYGLIYFKRICYNPVGGARCAS